MIDSFIEYMNSHPPMFPILLLWVMSLPIIILAHVVMYFESVKKKKEREHDKQEQSKSN